MTDINTLTDKFLRAYFSQQPDDATYFGYPGFDDCLPDYSPDKINETIACFEEIITEIENLNHTDKDEIIDCDLLKRKCQVSLFRFKSERHHIINPSRYVDTVSSSLFSIMTAAHYSDKEKIHLICGRLKNLPRFLAQAKETLKKPVKLWTDIASKEIDGVGLYLKDSILPFLKENQVVGADQLIELAKDSIYDFSVFLSNISDCRTEFAIGKDNFEFLLSTFHGIDKSAEEIRQIGFDKIDEISSLLNEQAEKIDDTKSWQELIQILKENHPTEDNLVESYQKKVEELKQFLIDNEIVSIPKEETLSIIETPKFFQESIPFAAYSAPKMFTDDGQGLFFVSPANGSKDLLKEHCFAAFPLTALHEAYPGHHLHFSHQRSIASPMRKAYDLSSYYEGWTLYCEEMMYRVGFYDDAMRLYQLKDALWRAARIVVDVSMQAYGMTDEEAAQFLVDNAKLSNQGARVDVNWYTQSPSVPMSYLIGMLEVDQIRKDYQRKGKSLKEFHDNFLKTGAIPLNHVRNILIQEG